MPVFESVSRKVFIVCHYLQQFIRSIFLLCVCYWWQTKPNLIHILEFISIKSASLTVVLKRRCPRGQSAPSLWLFECCSAALCSTHNSFNDHSLRYYGLAVSSNTWATRWGKQHQGDWFILMGHFIMEGKGVGESDWGFSLRWQNEWKPWLWLNWTWDT